MNSYSNRTTEDLVNYIKISLGYPTVNVELTDDQIKLCINDAIQEILPWYSSHRYLTTDAKMVIDLTDYDVLMVTDIFKVLPASSSSLISDDPFSIQSGISSGQVVAGSMRAGRYSGCNHRVLVESAKLSQEILYSRLANTMNQRLAGAYKDNISYEFIEGKLYLDTGYPSSSIVTIEYIPKVTEVEDFTDDRYYKYLKDLSIAFCNVLMARVVGKYEVASSPSSINHDRMYQDGKDEIERIRRDLRDTVDAFFITD